MVYGNGSLRTAVLDGSTVRQESLAVVRRAKSVSHIPPVDQQKRNAQARLERRQVPKEFLGRKVRSNPHDDALKSQIKSLIDMSESNSWATVNKVMKDEILELALMMARSKEMSQQEMDFNRGAIWAAEQMLNLPSRLIHKLEGEISFDEAPSRQGRTERVKNGDARSRTGCTNCRATIRSRSARTGGTSGSTYDPTGTSC